MGNLETSPVSDPDSVFLQSLQQKVKFALPRCEVVPHYCGSKRFGLSTDRLLQRRVARYHWVVQELKLVWLVCMQKNSKPQKSHITLPETNSSPLKIGLPNRNVVFQPSIFRGYVSFREGIIGVFFFSLAFGFFGYGSRYYWIPQKWTK